MSTKTLQDAVNTEVGKYISGQFQANLSNAKVLTSKKSGKSFYTATLSEGSLTCDVVSFSRDFTPLQGHLVKFGGMGMKREDNYNGKAKISLGDKSIWTPVGPAGESAPVQTAESPVMAQKQPSRAIEGVTVGMALNKAVDIACKTGDVNEDVLWQWASTLIRISQRLQAGDLAPVSELQTNDEAAPY